MATRKKKTTKKNGRHNKRKSFENGVYSSSNAFSCCCDDAHNFHLTPFGEAKRVSDRASFWQTFHKVFDSSVCAPHTCRSNQLLIWDVDMWRTTHPVSLSHTQSEFLSVFGNLFQHNFPRKLCQNRFYGLENLILRKIFLLKVFEFIVLICCTDCIKLF